MLKTQQFLLGILALLFLSVVMLLVIQNLDTPATYRFIMWNDAALPNLSLGLLLLSVSLLTALGIACRMLQGILSLKQRDRQKHRELERSQISLTAATDKVSVLEAKIVTLETALSKALQSHHPEA